MCSASNKIKQGIVPVYNQARQIPKQKVIVERRNEEEKKTREPIQITDVRPKQVCPGCGRDFVRIDRHKCNTAQR
jgi:hypothetical protein